MHIHSSWTQIAQIIEGREMARDILMALFLANRLNHNNRPIGK